MRLPLTITALLAATPAFAGDSSSGGDPFMGLIVLAILIGCYFFPTLIALGRRHRNTLAIFLLNLFLGWTFCGWIASLVWAATAVKRRIT
ncbi:superinfection immunity protein [Bradyrhizobium sp. CCGUVB1N3]|uniref:superinfection immunity protein n=1 Tax=Bradyrhizobium sp. CCGUVB1N3 TaxID=2949629 RepID=UPI0020B45B4F|nr:superinfection immunity protein [Bradyrhizobium sp. CCGUVB1N3]MCP3471393.1 superinfection immunity protein [Bradyrhizobium sp. CCGUVB1N3]